MNYQTHYSTLMNRAKARVLEGYVERHHIIPKCLGGTDDIDNLVALTPEEHYVAHLLLVKMHPDHPGLAWAATMMCSGNKNHRRSNKMYGWLKRRLSSTPRKPMSEESRRKVSESTKASPRGKDKKPRKKRTLSPEHRAKLAAARKGWVWTDEMKERISQSNIKTKRQL